MLACAVSAAIFWAGEALLANAAGIALTAELAVLPGDERIRITPGDVHGDRRGIGIRGSGGIGGGAIVDGHQLRGAAGYAGELGHVRISAGNAKDYSGLSGTLESLVRRDDLLDIFKFDSAADEELDAEIRSTKSTKAVKLLNEQIDALGLGLSNFVNIFNPQVVVLAGFLTSLFRFDEERLINRMREGALGAAHERVVIRSAELGSDLLMFGAAELPFGDLISRPSNAKLITPKGKGAK